MGNLSMDPLNALGPCVEIVKCSCSPFARRIGYLFKLEKNMSILIQKNQELIAKETDIQRELRRSRGQRKIASDRVSVLLEEVSKVKDQVNGIARSLEESRGCFSNCYFRLQIAKRVVDATQEVDRLLGETGQYADGVILVDQSPSRALSLPAPALVGKLTVQKNLDAILEALRDPMVGKIGIYAMGGSGKTTTIMNINNQLETTEDFDKIIWVTVSKDLNLDKVQNDIAKQLHLDLSTYDDQVQRASELYHRLKQVNKFLIIFDDMWDRIPLERVGIPEPDRVNMCKIVLTTRSLTVCHGMETHKNIKLQLLSEEEAWELFVSKAVSITPSVRPFAEKLAHKCGGLPLAINTVGRAMRGEVKIRLWRKALKDLRSSPTEIEGMEEEVFKVLQFSYRRLKNDIVRKCFLYVALFPEDYKIETEKLVRYWMSEKLIDEQGDLEAEMDEGFKILKELVDACMFEEFEEGNFSYRTDFIRMHDSLRDLAIKIMEEAGGLFVKDGLDEARKISLMDSQIEVLGEEPTFPHLSTLVLWSKSAYPRVSSSFFDQILGLQILDLSHCRIKELPASLSDLCKLRALLLQNCTLLEEIPSLAELQKLQVLNLSRTAIKKLPEGMENLTSLRYLDISCTRWLENCTIPKLDKLEELRFDGSEFWKMDSPTVSECINEIKNLTSLAVLTLTFVDWDDYLNAIMCLPWETLNNFYIEINNCMHWGYPDKKFVPKTIHMSNQIINSDPSTSVLPPNVQHIRISDSEIQRLSVLLCNLEFLSKCSIRNCTLLSGDSLILGDEMKEYTFSSLEHLKLSGIDNCPILLEGMMPQACFTNLRVLKINGCDCLKNLFYIDHVKHFKNIEVIKVMGCELLEELIVDPNGDQVVDSGNTTTTTTTTTPTIILPKLHTLIFERLPELHTISRMMWVCVSLCYVEVDECPNLKKLPFSGESLSNLEKIQGEIEWWEALEWDDADVKKILQPRYKCTE